MAITLPTRTNASLSTAAGAKAAIAEPSATPITAGSAHARTTSIITAPWSRWVRNESTLVGTMIAIDVPTQSWKRTSSGTSSARKTSYRTGTMSAPPPMPNRPARMPVIESADDDQGREQQQLAHGHAQDHVLLRRATARNDRRERARFTSTRSCAETALSIPCVVAFSAENRKSTFPENAPGSSGGGLRHSRVHVHNESERIAEGASIRARLHRLDRQMAAEGTRARDATEQAEHVPRRWRAAACRARARARDTGPAPRPLPSAMQSGAGSPNSTGSTASRRHGS